MSRTILAAALALLAITTPARAAIVESLDADLNLTFPNGTAQTDTLTGSITLTRTDFPGEAPYELDGNNISLDGNLAPFNAHFSKETVNTFYFFVPSGLQTLTFNVDDIWNPTFQSFILNGLTSPPGITAVGGNVTITDEIINPTPLPPALPLFASGIAALGLIGWRKRGKLSEARTAPDASPGI